MTLASESELRCFIVGHEVRDRGLSTVESDFRDYLHEIGIVEKLRLKRQSIQPSIGGDPGICIIGDRDVELEHDGAIDDDEVGEPKIALPGADLLEELPTSVGPIVGRETCPNRRTFESLPLLIAFALGADRL